MEHGTWNIPEHEKKIKTQKKAPELLKVYIQDENTDD